MIDWSLQDLTEDLALMHESFVRQRLVPIKAENEMDRVKLLRVSDTMLNFFV